MPTVKESKNIDVEIDFSVYCGICGSGVCNETDIDRHNNLTVTCSNCQKAFDSLNKQIDQLEYEKEYLEGVIKYGKS